MNKVFNTKLNLGDEVFTLVDVSGTSKYLTPRKKVSVGHIKKIRIEYHARYDEPYGHRKSGKIEEDTYIVYTVSFPPYDDTNHDFYEEENPEYIEIFKTKGEAEKARDDYNKSIEEKRNKEKKDIAERNKLEIMRKFKELKEEANEYGLELDSKLKN